MIPLDARTNFFTPRKRFKMRLMRETLNQGKDPLKTRYYIKGEWFTFDEQDLLDYQLFYGIKPVLSL